MLTKTENAALTRRKRFWAEFTSWLANAMDDELTGLEERLRAVAPSPRVGRHISVALNREVRRRIRQPSAV
ncbi:hypothetical protein JYK21_11235 [Ralstonia pickettii]|nr:hypothetical protein [Ralstonia pickettii]